MATRRSNRPQQIRQDFLDAIERLRDGRPQHQELRNKLAKGRNVPVNVSNVAKEAGRARSLIARDDSPYPDIRHRIQLESGEVRDAPRNSDDVITDLRSQVADLRSELKKTKEIAAYHLERRQKAEREAERLRQIADRAQEDNKALRQKLAAAEKGQTVVSLRGDVDPGGRQ